MSTGMEGRRARWMGRLGMVVSVLLWMASIAALLQALRANETAGLLAHGRGGLGAGVRVEHLRGLAVMWCLVLGALQIAAGLVGAGVLRGVYRLLAAVCFAVSGCTVILLNTAWMFALLLWLRMYGDTG